MVTRPFPLTSTQIARLDTISATSVKERSGALELLYKREKALSPDELEEVLRPALEGDVARAVVTFALLIASAAHSSDRDAESVVEAIRLGTEEWTLDEGFNDRWQAIKEFLVQVGTQPAVIMAAKATNLYYKHLYHNHELKIVTEARPVFSADASTIDDYIVHNVLHFTYSNGSEQEEYVEVSLGVDDIGRLIEEAQRALTKTKTLVETFKRDGNFEPRIYRARH